MSFISGEIQDKLRPTENKMDVRQVNVTELKNKRAGYKSTLTRYRNQILDLMDSEDNVKQVKSVIIDMDNIFEKFSETHKLYSSYVDEKEVGNLADYYNEVLLLCNGVKERASGWMAGIISRVGSSEVCPEDSVSNTGWRCGGSRTGTSRTSRVSCSSQSSVKARQKEEEAKRKALQARMQFLSMKQQLAQKRFYLQQEEAERKFRLQQEEEYLNLQGDLAESMAREGVYAKAKSLGSECKPVNPVYEKPKCSKPQLVKTETLDPLAPEFPIPSLKLNDNPAGPPSNTL